jgi:hypothetical protein
MPLSISLCTPVENFEHKVFRHIRVVDAPETANAKSGTKK